MLELLRKAPGYKTARAVRDRFRTPAPLPAIEPPPAAIPEPALPIEPPPAAMSEPLPPLEPPPAAVPEPAPPIEPPAYTGRQDGFINRMAPFATVFDGVTSWAGEVPKGFIANFAGALTDARFHAMWGVDPAAAGGGREAPRPPVIEEGEPWFEAVDWVLAAREAKDRFVMITLGA